MSIIEFTQRKNPVAVVPEPSFGQTAREGFDGLNPLLVLQTLRRNKWVVLGVVALVMGLAILYLSQVAPRYHAEAVVTLKTRDQKVLDIDSVMSGLSLESSVVNTEVAVIKSRMIAEKVVREQKLLDDPRFRRLLTDTQSVSDKVMAAVGLNDPASLAPLTEQELFNAAASYVVGGVTAEGEYSSYIIRIGFEAPSPELAAKIADGLAAAYVGRQVEEKTTATEDASGWLDQRLVALRSELRTSEEAVEAYKSKHRLIGERGMTMLGQQLAELNGQLAIARGERARAEARLTKVNQLLTDASNTGAIADIVSSPEMEDLRRLEARTVQERANNLSRYRSSHPTIVKLNAELAGVRGKIRAEASRIVASLENDLAVATAREQSLAEVVTDIEDQVVEANQADVRLRELEREAAANKEIFQSFLERLKETNEQRGVQDADAQIISSAAFNVWKSYPRTRATLAMAFVVAVVAGVGVSLLIELLIRGFKTVEEVEQVTGLPVLSVVPSVDETGMAPEDFILQAPRSPFAETVRGAHTTMAFASDAPPKVILVSSALPDEGKTSFAVSLGRSLSMSGHNVLLVDCDMRKSEVAKRLNVKPTRFLDQILKGECSASEAVAKDHPSGLNVIGAREVDGNPQSLLASKAMKDFVDAEAKRRDLVIIDSPAMLPVTDTIVLSNLADARLFIVRWRSTQRQLVQQALRQLTLTGQSVTGIVLSRVDFKRFARYGYGNYSSYLKYYQDYAPQQTLLQA